MKILKHQDNIIDIIVGEMLNIELSREVFINGVMVDNASNNRYPNIGDGNVLWDIKAAYGYILVPPGYDCGELVQDLIDKIVEMSAQLNNYDVLKSYHDIKVSYSTNIKVKSALMNTTSNPRRGNIKRLITPLIFPDEKRVARFTWYVVHQNSISYQITDDNMSDSIAKHICSVLYDRDNIVNLNHNDVTFDYSEKLLKGNSNVIDESIKLFKYGNPVALELSEWWSKKSKKANIHPRNIPRAKVYEGEYSELNISEVVVHNGADCFIAHDICDNCHTPLYDDNYVLDGDVNNPDNEQGIPMCPLCVHIPLTPDLIETKYLRLLRVKFPKTTDDIIQSRLDLSTEKRDLLSNAIDSVEYKEGNIGGKQIKYVMIGKNYVGFYNITDYLYSTLSVCEDLKKRKVCTIKSPSWDKQ
jgi:hypothetical protein